MIVKILVYFLCHFSLFYSDSSYYASRIRDLPTNVIYNEL